MTYLSSVTQNLTPPTPTPLVSRFFRATGFFFCFFDIIPTFQLVNNFSISTVRYEIVVQSSMLNSEPHNPQLRSYKFSIRQPCGTYCTLCTSLTDSAKLKTLFASHTWMPASPANFRVHTRVILLIYSDERPLLIVCFFQCLETSHFCCRWFSRHAIYRLSHTFPSTWNVFTYGAPILKIYSACSFMDIRCSLLETLEELRQLHVFYACAEHFWEQICMFLASMHAQSIRKWLGHFFFMNDKIQNSERLSIFPERPNDFNDFQESIQ